MSGSEPTFTANARAYPLPTPRELPPNRVDWELEPARAALLLRDLQGYYLSALHPDAAAALVENVRRLAADCRRAVMPIFASRPSVAREPDERGLMLEFAGMGIGYKEPSAVATELGMPERELRGVFKRG